MQQRPANYPKMRLCSVHISGKTVVVDKLKKSRSSHEGRDIIPGQNMLTIPQTTGQLARWPPISTLSYPHWL